jgi:hypothetical protein
MDLRSIKPGMLAASLAGKVHPRTGELLEPLGYTKSGVAIWPVIGGEGDDSDPNDPRFTGKDDDDPDDDEDKHRKPDDDDDDDEDDDNPRLARASRQAAKYRKQLREQEARNAELEKRLRAIEDKDKKPEEINNRELTEAKSTVDRLTQANRDLSLRLAIVTTPLPGVEWVDVEDTLALAERLGYLEDLELDDDGNVDRKALRAALRELAKRKPHLVVKKAGGRKSDQDDDEDEGDNGQGSSAPTMNGKRKGDRTTADREALKKRFPVLGARK